MVSCQSGQGQARLSGENSQKIKKDTKKAKQETDEQLLPVPSGTEDPDADSKGDGVTAPDAHQPKEFLPGLTSSEDSSDDEDHGPRKWGKQAVPVNQVCV